MRQRSIPTGDKPAVVIDEVYGGLDVKGWPRPEVMLQSSAGDEQDLLQQGDVVHVHTMGDCLLRVPAGTQVEVVAVHGRARIKYLEDGVKIGRVLGSLYLRDVGGAQVESVYGDLFVRQVESNLSVKQVLGNASIRQVQGSCALERVAGNLDLRDAEGELSASVGGNARLSFSLLAGQSYRVDAGGNLVCRLPLDASLQANLTSGAQEILVSLPDDRQTYKEGTHQLTLGDGRAAMDLSAGGMLSLISQENGTQGAWDISLDEELIRDIGAQVEAEVAFQVKAMDERMAGFSVAAAQAGLPPQEVERIMRHANESNARASARAQEKMQRAQERMRHKMDAAQRKAEQKARHAERHQGRHAWNFVWTTPPVPPAAKPPAGEPAASDEERLMILRMLEQKKITLEEAEKLLQVLEGK
jgi:SHOCT-like domain